MIVEHRGAGVIVKKKRFQENPLGPNSGRFEINGVAQAPYTVLTLTESQLAQTTFVAGMGSGDVINVSATDSILGQSTGTTVFTVSVPNVIRPTLTTSPVSAT